jgi:hypothetical protein
MKIVAKICTLLLAVALFTNASGTSQAVDAFKHIATLMKNGNVEKLAQQMDLKVELQLLEVEQRCSPEQVHLLLTDFTQKNPITNFSMIHVGAKDERSFGIGLLSTEKGKLRVLVVIRVDNQTGAYTIQQLTIENEN